MIQNQNRPTPPTTAPTVSVLMPVYNVEKYVAQAVESILNQTYRDFELIVLDDCSPDKSSAIIDQYDDKRIVRYKGTENVGLANILNVGIGLARGRYIARMDSDDVSFSNRLQTQVDYLEKHKEIALCSCGLEKFGTENDVWVRETNPEEVKITMMFFSPVLHATAIWRKEVFENNHLYYDQETFPAEDYDLWSRAIFHCRLVNIPQILYKYRIHGIQVTKIDDRAEKREKEIQKRYLKKALPCLKEKDREFFVEQFVKQEGITIQNVKVLKNIYQKVIVANNKDHFFDKQLLKERLKKQYQSIVFLLLKKESKYANHLFLLFDLSLKQIFKLFLK